MYDSAGCILSHRVGVGMVCFACGALGSVPGSKRLSLSSHAQNAAGTHCVASDLKYISTHESRVGMSGDDDVALELRSLHLWMGAFPNASGTPCSLALVVPLTPDREFPVSRPSVISKRR